MPDNWKVVDWAVDELQENLNAIRDAWLILHWDFYAAPGSRRVTVVMVKQPPPAVDLPPGFDPLRFRRN